MTVRVLHARPLATGGFLAVLGLAIAVPAAAQQLSAPCLYTDARGDLVITDNAADPGCAHLLRRPAGARRLPGRLVMTFEVAEMIAMAHDAAVRYRVDHRLVESLVEMESGFDPQAVSSQGAMGLMQLMPEVARAYGVSDPFDAFASLDAGVRLLRDLLLRFDGDLSQTLAAYNAGSGAVERYAGVPPYAETQGYVRRVLYRYRQRVEGAPLH